MSRHKIVLVKYKPKYNLYKTVLNYNQDLMGSCQHINIKSLLRKERVQRTYDSIREEIEITKHKTRCRFCRFFLICHFSSVCRIIYSTQFWFVISSTGSFASLHKHEHFTTKWTAGLVSEGYVSFLYKREIRISQEII